MWTGTKATFGRTCERSRVRFSQYPGPGNPFPPRLIGFDPREPSGSIGTGTWSSGMILALGRQRHGGPRLSVETAELFVFCFLRPDGGSSWTRTVHVLPAFDGTGGSRPAVHRFRPPGSSVLKRAVADLPSCTKRFH
eukprot:scaffold24_cov341-Pavlova_lutheri.AAC.30